MPESSPSTESYLKNSEPVPADVISHVMTFCSLPTLSNLSRVSKECNAIAIPELYRYLDLSLSNPLVNFNQDSATLSSCIDNTKVLTTPIIPHLQYTRAMFIPAHHHTQCFAGSSLTPTTKVLLPKLRSVHYRIDTMMYHWQYNCTLMRSFTPGPEELILSAKGFNSILYWTFATQCYEKTPAQVKTFVFLFEDSARNIDAGGWKANQTGRLRNFGSVRRFIDGEADSLPDREIRLVYAANTKAKGDEQEIQRELASGEIQDIATLALFAKKVTIIGIFSEKEYLEATQHRKSEVMERLRDAVEEQITGMGLNEKYDAEVVMGKLAFRPN